MAGTKRPRKTTTIVQYTHDAFATCPICGFKNDGVHMVYCGHAQRRYDKKRKRNVWAWRPKAGEAQRAPRLSR